MTNNQPDRLDRIEVSLGRVAQALDSQVSVNADLRSSVNSLIETVNQHQDNFMVLVTEIRNIRTDMQSMQADIRGLQTENRRILARLERTDTEET